MIDTRFIDKFDTEFVEGSVLAVTLELCEGIC